jgi:hypothetical protein
VKKQTFCHAPKSLPSRNQTQQLKEFDYKQLLFLWFKEEDDKDLFWLHEHDEDVHKTYKFLLSKINKVIINKKVLYHHFIIKKWKKTNLLTF